MGSDGHYPEEAPAHRVQVDGFAIDAVAVTNARVRRFRRRHGLRHRRRAAARPGGLPGGAAENLAPGSMVFTPTPGPVDLRHLSQWWTWMPGASWATRRARSAIDDRLDHPVVHVAHEDAAAYAAWAGAALPTEAQWEYAARGGLDGAAFTWGDEPRPDGRIMANTWDGPDFPWRSTGESGWLRTSPVGSFPANGFGLYDMAGNVWEWTDDWWTSRHPDAADKPCCAPANPRGGDSRRATTPRQPQFPIPRKVIKGGSHLCADSYCLRYRPAARRPQMVDTGMSHVGFRCVRPTHPTRRSPHDTIRLPSWRPGATRERSRVPGPSADVPAEDGSPLRQRRHPLVRAADLRAVRLLPRRAGRRAGATRRSAEKAEFAALLGGDKAAMGEIGMRAHRAGPAGLFEGRTPEEFIARAREFLGTATHAGWPTDGPSSTSRCSS